MDSNPERKIVFAAKIGADSMDDLIHELNQIVFELTAYQKNQTSNLTASGGYGSGGTWAFKINPSQTHDNYFIEINKWLEEHRGKEE